MGNQGSKRGSKEQAIARPAKTAPSAINERERIITWQVEEYLAKREKKQKKANILLFFVFCIYIAIAIAIFSVLYEIRRVNLDFVRMRERITKEMADDYKRQVQEQDKAINEYRKDRKKE